MIKKFQININSAKYFLLLILLLSVLFRFYNFRSWITFGMDQENEYYIVRNIVQRTHFPAIGLSAGDTGLYRGPVILYLSAIPYALARGNPVGGAVLASSLGVFVTLLVFFIARRLFTEKIALLSSFMYSSSFLISYYDRQFWNPVFMPLFSLLMGYLIFLVLKGKVNLLPWLFLLFGLSTHAHLSTIIFFPLIIYAVWANRKVLNKRIIFVSLLFLVLTQSSLIFFDIRHNFQNTRTAINIITQGKYQKQAGSSLFDRGNLFISMLGRFYWVPPHPDLFVDNGQCPALLNFRKNPGFASILIMFLIILTTLIILIKAYPHKPAQSATVIGILILVFLSVLIYSREMFEYQFLLFFPWLSISVGLLIDKLLKINYLNYIALIFIFSFLFLNLLTLFTAKDSYSYTNKVSAAKFAKNYISPYKYSLEAVSGCPLYGGYRYIFDYFAGTPASSYMDIYFSWLYKVLPDKKIPRKVYLLFMDKRDLKSYNQAINAKKKLENKMLAEKQFGNILVMVVNNE